MQPRRILVTGATGYVGGRLVPELLEQGHIVRCLARQPQRLDGRPWRSRAEVVEGDVLNYETLVSACRGVEVAYYLVNGVAANGPRSAESVREAADTFARAARESGVRHIIYLGCLASHVDQAHPERERRSLVGEQLGSSGIPVTEFQSTLILGSGSLSFELVRYLTERDPIMVCPAWVKTRVQPIAIRTVIAYLVAALDRPELAGVYEIGGRESFRFLDLFRLYARQRGLRRSIFCLPALPVRVSVLWTRLVTPFPAAVVRTFVKNLAHDTVTTSATARSTFGVNPLPSETALQLAFERRASDRVVSAWHDAVSSSLSGELLAVVPPPPSGLVSEGRSMRVSAAPPYVFRAVSMLGGETGWMFGGVLWRLRGFLDRLVGGVGLRRGRRSTTELRVGDALDFWRVQSIRQNRLLRLHAEMKVPGQAWLQFDVRPDGAGGSWIRQTALFDPKGVWGLLYWYTLFPIHQWMFRGMLRALSRRATLLEGEELGAASSQPQPNTATET